MKAVKAKRKIWERKQKNPSHYKFNCLFSISSLVDINIFTDEYYPSGYFPRTGTMGW